MPTPKDDINTSGGAYIGGDVSAGDFTGRDRIETTIHGNAEKLTQIGEVKGNVVIQQGQDAELISPATSLLSAIQQEQSKANAQTVQNIYGDSNAVAGTGGTATIYVQSQPKSRRRKAK